LQPLDCASRGLPSFTVSPINRNRPANPPSSFRSPSESSRDSTLTLTMRPERLIDSFARKSSRRGSSSRTRAHASPGVSSLFATSAPGVHLASPTDRSVRTLATTSHGRDFVPPSGFLSLSTVCSCLTPRGLVSCRCHVQGSFPPRAFPSGQPHPAPRRTVPSCRCLRGFLPRLTETTRRSPPPLQVPFN
jgi:hypothetical protein